MISEKKQKKKIRKTVGLLLDNVYESYGIKIWSGLVDGARLHDINLICFVGGSLKSPYKYIARKNVIYDLVDSNNLDGLIAISGSLGNHVGMDYLRKFYFRYHPLPIVSIGVHFHGFPSLIVDNSNGIRDIITHLIKVHGFKKIAFIRGPECNPEAEWRYQIYKAVLEEHSIEFDPNLVAPGDFIRSTGIKAVSLLLDERKVRFDALMGANDYMAIYAMKALKARGIRIPQDIAVVGFDDIKESFGIIPSLTTVRQPLYEVGKKAADIMFSRLNGEQVPELLQLPTKLVIRRSCGCFLQNSESYLMSMLHESSPYPKNSSAYKRTTITSELAKIMENNLTFTREKVDVHIWASRLIEALFSAMTKQSCSDFLFVLEDFITTTTQIGTQALSLYIVISALFSHVIPLIPGKKESTWVKALWKESLIFIGEIAERIQAYYRANAEEQSIILHKINQALITNFNMNKLKRVLIKDLPALGIKSCYLSLYVHKKNKKMARIVFAYNEQNILDFTTATFHGSAKPILFPSNQLVPGYITRNQGSFAYIALPLCFKTEQLGFVLFEIGPISGTVYETLASQLSSALKGAKLVSKRKRLEKEITEVSRKEQQRIGQDLHDGLCQYLTGIAFMCNVLKDRLKAKSLEEAGDAEEILKLIYHSITTTKNLARGLLPIELEEDGLIVALKDLAVKIEYQFKIPCHCDIPENILVYNSLTAVHLYRIVQEAVNNAIKHGKPENIYIQLKNNREKIILSVWDDGIGIPDNYKIARGMGLRTMKYRADIIDAKIDIKQRHPTGTMVICVFRNKPAHTLKGTLQKKQ